MERAQLVAKQRTELGKKTKALRREGLVPAIIYGHGMKPLPLQVNKKELYHALHTKAGENVLIDLKVDGVKLKESTCLIKEMQHDPISDDIQHVDFTVVSLTEKISVKVPLVLQHAEEALGVKEGGVMDVVHHEIEVECLPTQIPGKIAVDVKEMKIGDAIQSRDLPIPQGVTCKLDPEEVVIALHPPVKEEVAAPAEEGAAEPEVIEKGKKVEAEEGAEAPVAPAAKAAAPASKTEKK